MNFRRIIRIINTPVRLLGKFINLFESDNSEDRKFALEVFKTLGLGFAGFSFLLSGMEILGNRQIAQEQLITERFSQAVEYLNSEEKTLQTVGIHGLEGIAKDSEKHYWTIMNLLTFYVRETYPLLETEAEAEGNSEAETKKNSLKINLDLQTVLTVIGRREDPPGEKKFSLIGLSKKEFNHHSGDGESEDKNDRPKGNPHSIDLSSSNLEGANFYNANLEGANFYDANLEGGDFRGADLKGANLGETKLTWSNLAKANLVKADLTGAILEFAYLKGAELKGAELRGAELRGAYLIGVDLREADFEGADFEGAILYEADLRKADLEGADLRRTYLERANFEGTYLGDAENLTHKQIKSACFWERAIYIGKWNKEQEVFEPTEPDNTDYIDKLKKDKKSDPKDALDCNFKLGS